MNLILFEQQEINGQSVSLFGRRAKHIRKVLRSKPGDIVRIGIIDGPTGTGLIKEVDRDQVLIEISAATTPPPKSPTGLILALPRPIMLKRVLSQAASMGVERIFLINAGRVEKSFFSASIMTEVNLRQRLVLGLEQAMDTVVPEISIHNRFRPFVEDLLPAMSHDYPVKIIAHPDDGRDINEVILPNQSTGVLVAIGPEGGWSDFEIDLFRDQDFQAFTLGPRILRVDTAVPAILAQLGLLRSQASG
ncbi:MAG: 16S rRNA (uracil(1498)-N(3))-methyltransferase [Thermodesulfobacteriota bacterium]